MTVNLLGLEKQAFGQFCAEMGEKPFRARQLMRWIHQSGVDDFDAMTDMAKPLREQLERRAAIARARGACATARPPDGTRKWLLDVGTGNAIEAVFIPEDAIAADAVRFFAGRLRARVLVLLDRAPGFQPQSDASPRSSASCGGPTAASRRRRRGVSAPITNVVMMGMGEPLANFDNVVAAMQLMLDDNAYGLSRRRVTLSTSGLVPAMDRLREACPVALAVSLHAPNDALRDQLVPINRKYPLKQLLAACLRYIEKAPRDFVTFEYVMLDGVNDSVAQARELVQTGDAGAVQDQPDSVQSVSGLGL